MSLYFPKGVSKTCVFETQTKWIAIPWKYWQTTVVTSRAILPQTHNAILPLQIMYRLIHLGCFPQGDCMTH